MVRIFSKMCKSFTLVVLLGISSCRGRTFDSYDINNAMGKDNLVDALVAGSGGAGLNAAMYYARQGYNVLVLEGDTPGGQLTRTNEVENFPGVVGKSGPELMEIMRDQAEGFGVEFAEDSLQNIDFSSWPYKITTEDGEIIHALSVIITTGSSPRELGVPGEKEYFSKGVFTCAICDGFLYKGKDVIVVGGGDAAVEEALQLINFGVEKVTVLVRAKMRAVKCLRDRLKEEDKIIVKRNTIIQEILGDGEFVTGVRVLDKITGQTYVIPVSGVLIAIGSVPNTWFLQGKMNMNQKGCLLLEGRSQETSQKAVYAAGDVEANIPHQAIIAAGMGRKAAIEAVKFLTEEVGLTRKMRAKLQNSYYRGKNKKNKPVTKIVKPEEKEKTTKKVDKKGELEELKDITAFDDNVLKVVDKVVIVDFYTEFCPTCKAMMPHMEKVAKEFPDKVAVYKVDAGSFDKDTQDIKDKYKIVSVPRVLVFKNGKIVEDFTKSLSEKKIRDFVQKHVSNK